MFSALTFNMQNGQVWDEENPDGAPVEIEATIDFLKSAAADVIFLQEVEQGYDGGCQIEPPPNYTRLREALPGYDSVFGYPLPNPLELPFGLGMAIFSRTPLTGFRRVDLPPANIRFEYGGVMRAPSHRLLVEARTTIEGHPVRLLNAHLQAFFMIRCSSDEHRGQRDSVERELRRQNGATLLGGDFNCAPGESLTAQFERAGFLPSQRKEITWRRRPFVLDHIFFNACLRLEKCEVLQTRASDHHAVRSEFSFAG